MSEITAQPPLVGLRALDLASYFAGPGAAMFLADYGVRRRGISCLSRIVFSAL